MSSSPRTSRSTSSSSELGYTSTQTGTGAANIAGQATVKLELANIVNDHDGGTTDEFRFDVYVDPNGNSDAYNYVSQIAYDRDAPFNQTWGNAGPVLDRHQPPRHGAALRRQA